MQESKELVARRDFGSTEIANVIEQQSAAVAAREQALVQARFIMALQRPRNLEDARVRLKDACKIFEFADEAWYSRPAGKEYNENTGQWEEKMAEGFSIRFAEEAGRALGNMLSDSQIIAETPEERIVHVWAMDLETNFTRGVSLSIPKTVERKTPRRGQIVLQERETSKGEKVFICAANRNEMATTQANLVAKAERQCILKMIPAWILRDCQNEIRKTLTAEVRQDPDAARRKMLDAFAEYKIMPSDIQAYLGHTTDRMTAEEVIALRNIYRAITQGETTWDEIMAAREPHGTAQAARDVAEEKIARMKEQRNTTPANESEGGAQKAESDASAPLGETPSADGGTHDEIPGPARPGLTEPKRRLTLGGRR